MATAPPYEVDQFEYLRPEHSEEMEVLLSIYDGDENFKVLNGSTIQYKIGEHEEPLSILVEFKWTENYPEGIPSFSLDCFYNQHLSAAAKKETLNRITEEAWKNVGEQQTYTLIEWMKENILQIIGSYVFDEVCRIENRENEGTGDGESPKVEEAEKPKKESRKEQMTKAQKRREWDKMDKEGKLARGHDWVDVVRHLSQTGGAQSSVSGATGSAAGGSVDVPKSSTQ